MTPTTVIIVAFLLAFVAISAVFGGPVIVALPIAVVGIAAIGFFDFSRRRKQTHKLEDFREEAEAEKVEFTERDKETLASSD
jgi:UDP-N-acetylmuramyl pentapeptide phosphotransferase/UDP-N-acetylglucosamine-1-phosphate transferase